MEKIKDWGYWAYDGTSNVITNHWKKIAFLGVGSFALSKRDEISKAVRQGTQMVNAVQKMRSTYKKIQEDNEQAEKERLEQSFERQWGLGKNCSTTVLQSARSSIEEICNLSGAQGEIAKLKGKTGADVRQEKLQLWQNFIILGLTQCLLTLYTFCFLHLLVRLELCIARRHEFNRAQRNTPKARDNEDSERRREASSNRFKSLLNACSLLTSEKVQDFQNVIHTRLHDAFSAFDASTDVSSKEILEKIRTVLDQILEFLFTEERYLEYFLEPLKDEYDNLEHLEEAEMHAEIKAIIRLESFRKLVTECVLQCFFIFEIHFQELFGGERKPFVKVTAVSKGSFNHLVSQQPHNPLVKCLDETENVKELCRIVFVPLRNGGLDGAVNMLTDMLGLPHG